MRALKISEAVLLGIALASIYPMFAQTQTAGQDQATSSVDFRALSDQRAQLDSEVHGLQRKIDELNTELGKIGSANESLAYWQGAAKDKNPAAPAEVKAWRDLLAGYRREEIVKKELEDVSKDLVEKHKQLASVESKINAAINVERPRQEFKKTLSIAFTVLIGIVILGFYWIIRGNPSVGSSIFAGDAGLQFVTLFSLIIAIILFGMTEVLQGRELAALLGGISGYILGRSARGRDNERVTGGSVGAEVSAPAGVAADEVSAGEGEQDEGQR